MVCSIGQEKVEVVQKVIAQGLFERLCCWCKHRYSKL